MEIVIAASALKHGITRDEIFEALENHIYVIDNFDESRIQGLPSPTLHIGKTKAGKTLEILSYVVGNRIIFHCMELRGKTYLRAMTALNER